MGVLLSRRRRLRRRAGPCRWLLRRILRRLLDGLLKGTKAGPVTFAAVGKYAS